MKTESDHYESERAREDTDGVLRPSRHTYMYILWNIYIGETIEEHPSVSSRVIEEHPSASSRVIEEHLSASSRV